jgi:hypothetical protein|tara:strand:+ start:274 stop:945 length:672 start_codon:yes stop_codon:yes gene_type:complete
MPRGLLGKLFGGVSDFLSDQGENLKTARKREDAGGIRNPWMKSGEEQAQLAAEYGTEKQKHITNRALASKYSQGTPDTVTGTLAGQFDPNDSESVMKMQQSLNRAGIKDEYGEALAEDGRMGPKTLSAVRAMQKTRGEFIGPEGSDVEGLNQAVQETTGRKADMPERNALLNKQNWLDSIFQRKDPFGPGERLGATTEDYSGTPTETMPSREDRDRGANLWRR